MIIESDFRALQHIRGQKAHADKVVTMNLHGVPPGADNLTAFNLNKNWTGYRCKMLWLIKGSLGRVSRLTGMENSCNASPRLQDAVPSRCQLHTAHCQVVLQ